MFLENKQQHNKPMSEYDNTNTGVMFENDKAGNEKRPDRKGLLNVDGVDYWISGWIRTDKNGKRYMSLKVERKESQAERKMHGSDAHNTAKANAYQPQPDEDGCDDVPF